MNKRMHIQFKRLQSPSPGFEKLYVFPHLTSWKEKTKFGIRPNLKCLRPHQTTSLEGKAQVLESKALRLSLATVLEGKTQVLDSTLRQVPTSFPNYPLGRKNPSPGFDKLDVSCKENPNPGFDPTSSAYVLTKLPPWEKPKSWRSRITPRLSPANFLERKALMLF